MKIAFIVSQFPAISETFILRQITGLLDRGHAVDIFTHSSGNDSLIHAEIEKYELLKRTIYLNSYASSRFAIIRLLTRMGLLVASFHRNPVLVSKTLNVLKFGKSAALLQVLVQIAPFLNKGPYDIVHCQFGVNGELGVLLKETGICRGKVITTFHGYDVSSYIRQWGEHIYSRLFMKGDLFLCVSEYIRQKLITLGCDEQKAVILRCGVDTKKFCCSQRKPGNNGHVTILTIARLVEKKGVAYGIHAVAKLLKKHPQLEYRVVGDGPLKGELQNLIRELNATRNINLIGPKCQEEIFELLRGSDVFLAPSITGRDGDEEGIPTTIMEAFAQGLPVISTMHSGIPELVIDGESGFLVPERNVDALAEKLECLVEGPERRHRMGLRGREFVKEHHNIHTLNDRLIEIYRQ